MKGTLKLKLASLAVILAAAVLVPTAQAAEVSASLTSDTSGTALSGPIGGQPGVDIPVAFYVMVDVSGSPGQESSNPRIKVCNDITLKADGTFVCNAYYTFDLVGGVPGRGGSPAHNYTQNKTDANGNTFPAYVPVTLHIEDGIACPATYDLLEGLLSFSGTGVDFGGGALFLNLPFQVEIECTDWQGCSHGYWKNHTQSWEGYEFTDTVGSVFSNAGSLGDMTLLAAMQFTGPGDTLEDAKRILLQQAVASLLNADHSGVNFPMDEADLISAVNAMLLSTDRDAILALKDELDTNNNLGCPLN